MFLRLLMSITYVDIKGEKHVLHQTIVLFATGYLFLLTILVRMWQWRYGRIICQVPVKKGNASFCLLTIVFRETKINGLPANKANHRKTFIQMHPLTNTHLTLPRYKNKVKEKKRKGN